jgi:hypothetical protein
MKDMFKRLKYMNMYKCLFVFTSVLLFASVLCRICLSNALVGDNKKLSDLYMQKESLEKEVSKLSYLDASLSSLDHIEQRSKELGFVSMQESLLALDRNAPVSIATIISQ